MIPHLHLHLEPGERIAARPSPSKTGAGRAEFFRAHSLTAGRQPVTTADVRRFIADLHQEQRREGVDYVEVRLSPRRMLSDGWTWQQFVSTCDQALRSTTQPVVRGILLVNRDSPASFVRWLTAAVAKGLPQTFVGVDLAGDEQAHPDVSGFAALIDAGRAHDLGVTVHAGEFGGPEHIWRAIDVLGATRIGHGVSAVCSDALVARLARDEILVEVSLTSNRHLGALPDGLRHPAFDLHSAGVPICFNTDVPRHTGACMADEVALAAEALGTQTVIAVQSGAARHAFHRSTGP
jgi:adenosine deaminase